MKKWLNKWTRKLHRWGAVLTAVPLLLVIVTGLLLQVKKQVTWVQPPTQRGVGQVPTLTFNEILEQVRAVPEAGIETWDDVDRLDVRPGKGVIKVRANSHWELQLDAETGELLSSTYRRSDIIEALHDGSWFADAAKLWIFLPNGLILLALWITGAYLWALPVWQKKSNRRRRAARREPASDEPASRGE